MFTKCSHGDRSEDDSQLHTLGLLKTLRAECKSLWGASSEAYFRVDEFAGQPEPA
jgi:hypothetical protein